MILKTLNIFTFVVNNVGVNTIDLKNINPDDGNFDNNDYKTIIHVRLTFDDHDLEFTIYVILMAWCNKYKQPKAFKELGKELIDACSCSMTSSNIMGLVCVSEDEKKETE